MPAWGLLAIGPKHGLMLVSSGLLGVGGWVAAIKLDSGALVGLVGPLVIVVIAGFFTIRSNIAKIWRENYEAVLEENKVMNAQLLKKSEEKHAAISEASAYKALLDAEKQKTDLSAVTQAIDALRVELLAMLKPEGKE